MEITIKDVNKSLLKRLKKEDDKQLLRTAQSFKIMNRVNSSNSFQKNYNTLIFELKERNLLRS